MDKEKVLSLAKLARINLTDDEAQSLSGEFEAILDYVGEVKKAGKGNQVSVDEKVSHHLINVLREDKEPHETGLYTEAILEQAPMKEGNYIKVKKIL